MERLDESEVYKWFDILKNNNELVEIRLIGSNKTGSGYFTDAKTLIEAIKPYTDSYNCYFTLNTINPACYSREQKDKIVLRPKNTTQDAEIICRNYVLVDLDPRRPSGVCSTKEESMKAYEKGKEVTKFLMDNGFYEPIVVFSSSGMHLYLKCALLNNEENTKLVKRFLNAISMLFSDDDVDCDTSVYNAARISRLVGSYSCKGANNDATRPQRKCRFLSIPSEVKINEKEYFEKIAALYPEEVKPTRENNYSTEKFDLESFLDKHDIKVTKIDQVAGGKKYVLDHCVFNESHRGKDAVIFQRDNGAISYVCLHNSCSNYTWRDVRIKFEPNAYERKYEEPHRTFRPIQKEKTQIILQENDENKGNVWQCLSEIEDEDRSKIVSIPSGIFQYDKECCGFDKPSLSVWSGNNGCVDCDTEFFNGTRWKKISEYKETDYVMQYNSDCTTSLVKPDMYHKIPCSELTLMTNKTGSINQCLSDEHKLVYITSKGNLYKQDFCSFKRSGGHQCQIIPHFSYSGKGIDWNDDEIKLALAVSAEGYLWEKQKNIRHRVRINLKHNYKKKELEKLLDLCNIQYEKKKYNPHDLEFDTYLFYWDKSFKVFPLEWYGMSKRQFMLVKENITIWDGNVQIGRGGTYSTTKKENADFIQFCVTSLNHRCSIKIDNRNFRKNKVYILHFSKNHSNIRCYPQGLTFEPYKTKDGFKYCFSVPSGMLVLRRNNAINITGNSAKSTLLNQIAINAVNNGFKVAIYSGELRGKKMKRWLILQAAGKQYNKKSNYNSYDYYTPNNIKDKIVEWFQGKLYNYNTKYSHNIEQVCLEVEKLVKEHQIDMLIMDNLSCLDIDELDGSINEQQKAAIKMLLRMTERMEIATHVVIHPKKSELYLRKNDVSGAKTLTDLADCVFFVHRWNQDTQKAAKDFMQPQVYADLCSSETTNIVEVIKHREFGEAEGHIYKLFYEPESRRLKNSIAETIHYGWEEEHVQTNIEQMTIENGVKESDLITPYSNEVAPF